MLGHTWYNELTKKYVVVFGTMFNDIVLTKRLQDGTISKQVRVPISLGPKEKFLVRKEADPNLDRPYAISLPVMSFEMLGMIYAGDRKLQTSQRFVVPDGADNGRFKSLWQPVPYDLNFQLNIMTRTYDDGTQILEQILPFFTPHWTNTVNLIEQPEISLDVPLVLTGVSQTDTYESDFQTRRAIIWTLDFVMKAWYFGPTTNKKVIKVTNVDLYDKLDATQRVANINITPGMTANGEPTTDPDLTIPYQDINADDEWDYIVQVSEP